MNKLTLLLFLSPSIVLGQYISSVSYPDTTKTVNMDDPSVKWSNTITPVDLKAHLSILASDAYEGRETGEKGNEMAASYIANKFEELGLPTIGENSSHYQAVAFNRTQWKENKLSVNNNEYKHLWDYLTFASLASDKGTYSPENVVFLGYGIDDPTYSDYNNANVRGKAILINEGEPYDVDGNSRITGNEKASDWTKNIYKKLEVAKQKGVDYVFIISNEITKFLGENRKYLVSPRLELGDGNVDPLYADHAYVSSKIAKDLIGKRAKKIKRWRKRNTKRGKSKPVTLSPEVSFVLNKNVEVIAGNNVLGYVEGTDKKEEVVIVSAHYDHLGKRNKDVFNGADDNGSGTSTVLEIAEAFAQAKDAEQGPRRSVLFLLVTGEEKGLLGSEYYAASPIFPLENTIANVNIDMVGRIDKKYQDKADYVYVIGSDRLSSDLHRINEEMNHNYSQLILDYKYNDENDPNRYYFRSDHYNFAKNGIPAIFYFNGTHVDYHRTSDTEEKIQYPLMAKRAKHFFHTIWELANREERIVVDGEVKDY